MKWQNERWIKVYVRSNPDFLALSWQARGLFFLVLRELDPLGEMKLGKLGTKGVSVAIRGPWVEVKPFWEELVLDGCIEVLEDETAARAPGFVEAQEARQSDAARAMKYREMKKTSSVVSDEHSRFVTRCDAIASRSVTPASRNLNARHTPSHAVTIRSEEIRIDQNRTEGEPAPAVAVAPHSRGARLVKSQIPDEWSPSTNHYAQAKSEAGKGREWVDREAQAMRDWAAAKGERCCDWDARFRNWIRKAPEMVRAIPGSLQGVDPNDDGRAKAAVRAQQTTLHLAKRGEDRLTAAEQKAAASQVAAMLGTFGKVML
jgi:hypothetical protein